MGTYKYLDNIIENKLKSLHTAYLAKVLSVSNNTAKIQPLGLVTDANGSNYKQSVLTQVPICKHVSDLKTGNIVVVICCERNITDAKKGVNAIIPAGRHSMSDSIIIGVL